MADTGGRSPNGDAPERLYRLLMPASPSPHSSDDAPERPTPERPAPERDAPARTALDEHDTGKAANGRPPLWDALATEVHALAARLTPPDAPEA
jgi:hypothetical protein